MQSTIAVVVLTPLLLTAESMPDLTSMSQRVLLATAGLALLSSGVACVIYYWLLATLEATQAALVTYFVPLFAVAWGWAILDESITSRVVPGFVLIAAGVWLAGRPRRAAIQAPLEVAPTAGG